MNKLIARTGARTGGRIGRAAVVAATVIAATIGGGGAAFAAYPTDDPGTLKIDQPDCEFVSSGDPHDMGRVESTGFTVHYSVTAEDTTLRISDFAGPVLTRAVPIGEGELVVKWGDDGFDAAGALHMMYTATLESRGAIVSADIIGCPIPTVNPDGNDKTTGSGTGINSTGSNSTGSGANKAAKGSSGTKAALPETGLDATGLTAIAVAMLGVGALLVAWSRRREVTRS